MKDLFLKQAEREYSPKWRFMAIIIQGIFFMGVFPVILITLSSWLDLWANLPRFVYAPITTVFGWLFIVAGFLFGLWSVYAQFTIGRGTPTPIMATQKLITQKPYNYCRNPMALGTKVLYFGVAVLIGSLSAIGLVALGAILLLTYIKFIEEREMELRFGKAYREYRQLTPFLIPRSWRRN